MKFFCQECDTEANMSLNSPALPDKGLLLPPICIDKKFLTEISDHAAKKPRLTSHLVLRTTTTKNKICPFRSYKNKFRKCYLPFIYKSVTCTSAFQNLADQDVRKETLNVTTRNLSWAVKSSTIWTGSYNPPTNPGLYFYTGPTFVSKPHINLLAFICCFTLLFLSKCYWNN
jgi:hypothetical protein